MKGRLMKKNTHDHDCKRHGHKRPWSDMSRNIKKRA